MDGCDLRLAKVLAVGGWRLSQRDFISETKENLFRVTIAIILC